MIEVPLDERPGSRPGRLDVVLPGAVPGWVVRVLPALLVLGLGSAAGRTLLAAGVSLVLAVVAGWRPSGAVAAGLALVIGVSVLLRGEDLLDGDPIVLAGLVLGVHLVAAWTALSRHVAWRALVDPAAIGRLLLDLAPVQVASQALVMVAWAAHGEGSSLAWRAAGALALAVLVLVVVPGSPVSPRGRR